MIYPGQIVYIKDDKKIGIYLAWKPGSRLNEAPTCFVYTYIGKKGEFSDTCLYEPNDLIPVTMPDKKSVTKQSLYKSPFQRDTFANIYTDKESNEIEHEYLPELEKVLATKWFKAKYEVDHEYNMPKQTS